MKSDGMKESLTGDNEMGHCHRVCVTVCVCVCVCLCVCVCVLLFVAWWQGMG